MFDIGFWEVALIGIVTLLVVGPERLPEVARTAGRWVLKIRRFVAGVKSDFNRELQTGDLHKILGDQKEQINELRSIVNSTRRELESSTSDAIAAAKSKLDSVEKIGSEALSAKPASAASAVGSSISTLSDDQHNTDDSAGVDPTAGMAESPPAIPAAPLPGSNTIPGPGSDQNSGVGSHNTPPSAAPPATPSTDK